MPIPMHAHDPRGAGARPVAAVVAAVGLAMLLAGCGRRAGDAAVAPAPVASAASAGSAAASGSGAAAAEAEAAAAAVAAYFADAEVQVEGDAQRQELRRALTELLEQPAPALAAARYAGPDGTPGQRDLAALLRGHVVPTSPQALDLDTLLAAKASPRLAAVVRPRLEALGPAAGPAAAAASR